MFIGQTIKLQAVRRDSQETAGQRGLSENTNTILKHFMRFLEMTDNNRNSGVLMNEPVLVCDWFPGPSLPRLQGQKTAIKSSKYASIFHTTHRDGMAGSRLRPFAQRQLFFNRALMVLGNIASLNPT